MKTLLITLLFTSLAISQSQFRLNTKETGSLGLIAGLDTLGAEIEYSGTICARLFYTNKSIGGSVGVNFTSGMYEKFIYTTALRLHKKTTIAIPIAGLELGVNYNLTEGLFIGLRGTYDLKTEQNKTTTTPNGFVKLGFIF